MKEKQLERFLDSLTPEQASRLTEGIDEAGTKKAGVPYQKQKRKFPARALIAAACVLVALAIAATALVPLLTKKPVVPEVPQTTSETEAATKETSDGESSEEPVQTGNESQPDESESEFIEESVPIFALGNKEEFKKFAEEHKEKGYKMLDPEPLNEVFEIVSIICDPYYDGYSIDNYAGTIDVLATSIENDAESMIAYHQKTKYVAEESEEFHFNFFVYDSYDALQDHGKSSAGNEYFCMVYQKEGVNVYALQDIYSPDKYMLYFVVGGVTFRVHTLTFTYPHRETYEHNGVQGERIAGRLRANDEWENVCNEFGRRFATHPALIELSDITTESSALIRALKEAVAGAD